MTNYICKCGRSFQKSSAPDTTGYRLEGYATGHECYGCPYALAVKDFHWNKQAGRYDSVIRAWECRASQKLVYGTQASLCLGSKNSGAIYSLDLSFLKSVQDAARSIDGISCDSEVPGERGVQYGANGLYRLPIYPEQNKKGIKAKQQLFDMFFAPDGTRKDIKAEEEKQIVLREIKEAISMGKLNVGNIAAGLDKVKSVTESLSNVSHFEMVPIENIEPADYNPFADGDTDQSRYEVAMSIQANGLIEPLAVNKKSPDNYKLISGEHRFTAIKQYLSEKFKNIPCMVFEGISDDEAALKLYEANSHREYTAEQKFKRYQELERLLQKMKDAGTYHGGIQKGLAERLGVTTRQIRKYQTIAEKLTPEQQQAVIKGEVSINEACRAAAPEQPIADDQQGEDDNQPEKSGTGSAFLNQPTENKKEDSLDNTLDTLDELIWSEKIKETFRQYFNRLMTYEYYVFNVPTTQDAIRDFLKPKYGYGGRSISFPENVYGFCDCRSAQMEISYDRSRKTLTYSQVDDYIRNMIRNGELLTKEEVKAVVEKHLKNK